MKYLDLRLSAFVAPFFAVVVIALIHQPTLGEEALAEADASEQAAAEADPLAIPTGDSKELMQFMQGLFRQSPPADATHEQKLAHRDKILWTMVEAADAMRDREPSGQQLQIATQYKFMTLQMLAHKDEDAKKQLAEAETAARQDENPAIVAIGLRSYVTNRARDWSELSAVEQTEVLEAIAEARENESSKIADAGFQALVSLATSNWGQLSDEVKQQAMDAINTARQSDDTAQARQGWQAYVSLKSGSWGELTDDEKGAFAAELLPGDEATSTDLMAVQVVVRNFERRDPDFVKDLLGKALPKFLEAEDEEVRQSATRLEGIARRLNLPGNKMELTGTLLDGAELDWESYRGKVVLVDFWAVWCGPCRAEVPNILEMYKAYHDKGFDVLGISLDQTPEAAKKYIDEMGIPWKSTIPTEESDRGWNNPTAQHYGITGIPTAILLDKEGRAVHMNARGPVLGQQLQELLGAPVGEEDSPPAT